MVCFTYSITIHFPYSITYVFHNVLHTTFVIELPIIICSCFFHLIYTVYLNILTLHFVEVLLYCSCLFSPSPATSLYIAMLNIAYIAIHLSTFFVLAVYTNVCSFVCPLCHTLKDAFVTLDTS